MLRLAKKLGPEYQDDPSLLHPLFARLPPLYPDTPDRLSPPQTTYHKQTEWNGFDDNEMNPYDPLPLSDLFSLTDSLMERYPWDGDWIRGKEIMGEASVVCSYDLEIGPLIRASRSPISSAEDHSETQEKEIETWTLKDAVKLINGEVILPGSSIDDDEEIDTPDIRPRRSTTFRLPRNTLGTSVAFAVVFLGIGMAVYSVKSGGLHPTWRAWWRVVISSWAGKRASTVWDVGLWYGVRDEWNKVGRFLRESLKGIL